VGKHFILDYGCVLSDEDIFYGERRDFGYEDSAKGIGDRSIKSNKREGQVELIFLLTVELDAEILNLISVASSCGFLSRQRTETRTSLK